MEDKLELSDGSISIMQNIKNVFQELYDHYRAVANRNEYLLEENKRLKSEAYKDEELSKMKAQYDKMNADYYRGFPISESENNKINEWINKISKEYPGNEGAIGGRFTYEFIPTGVGTYGKIIDSISGKSFSFQEPW